eukprot:TRINITY_DN11442_c0_g1_i5.p1 TRINITY_DN11442_c0_g1~~TRINITY_DN11442_c0_g1_i5.p1  ORF type:complete len:279 (+),score=97.17 TRINITY_DN11442_c0_g1_i5:71-838(+)
MAATTKELTASVCRIVENVAAANEAHYCKVHESNDPRAFFDCVEVPALSFTNYVAQLTPLKRNDVWPLALILADRLCRKADCTFNPHQVHRLMLTAYCIACKLCYDLRGLCQPIAYRGSVGMDDLHRMERTFLICCDWEVTVTAEEYYKVVDNIEMIEAASATAAQCPGSPAGLLPDSIVMHGRSLSTPRCGAEEPKVLAPSPPARGGSTSPRPQSQEQCPTSCSPMERPRCSERIDRAKEFATSGQVRPTFGSD